MADDVFNISLGSVVEKVRDGAANCVMMLLKANETEADLVDRIDFENLLAQAGNTECDFTNYERKGSLTATITVDNTNNRVDVDIGDLTYVAAGGASNNTTTKAIVGYDETVGSPTEDDSIKPMTHHDFALTTDGNDFTLEVNANGFFRAA